MKRHWRRISSRTTHRLIARHSRPLAEIFNKSERDNSFSKIAFNVIVIGVNLVFKFFHATFYVVTTIAIAAFSFLQWSSSNKMTELEVAKEHPRVILRQVDLTLRGASTPPKFRVISNLEESKIESVYFETSVLLHAWKASCAAIIEGSHVWNSQSNLYDISDPIRKFFDDNSPKDPKQIPALLYVWSKAKITIAPNDDIVYDWRGLPIIENPGYFSEKKEVTIYNIDNESKYLDKLYYFSDHIKDQSNKLPHIRFGNNRAVEFSGDSSECKRFKYELNKHGYFAL